MRVEAYLKRYKIMSTSEPGSPFPCTCDADIVESKYVYPCTTLNISHTCSKCGYLYDFYTESTGNSCNAERVEETGGPLCQADIQRTYYCSVCGATQYSEIESGGLGHVYEGTSEDSMDWCCKYCGEPTYPGSGS